MATTLFLSLVCLSALVYLVNNKNILSPSVILCVVFSFSAFTNMLMSNAWDYNISINTVCIIVSSIIFFICGEFTCKKICFFKSKPDKKIYREINSKKIIFISIILMAMLYYYYYQTYAIFIKYSPLVGNENLLLGVRILFIQEEMSLGILASLFFQISQGISCVCIYIFIYEMCKHGLKIKPFVYIIPVIIYGGFLGLSSGRAGFIDMFVSIIILYGVIKQNQYYDGFVNKRLCFFGVLGTVVFYAIFTFLGEMRGVDSELALDMVMHYTGASIPALDYYIQHSNSIFAVDAKYLGEETLFTLSKLLNYIGFQSNHDVSRHLDFSYFGSITTNVYTSLRRYIHDYSYYGLILIQFLMGAFYRTFYNQIRFNKNNGFLLIIYANSIYPVFMMPIDDVFLSSFCSMHTIYMVFFIGVFYYVLISKNYDNI